MANYSYSTPYTGQQVPTLPPGYMEAATAPGRNLAMGIASMGQNIGKAIEQYRTKKADTESATQSWETVSGMMQQQLSSDPKYLAIQQYMDTGALPQGVTEKDIPQFTQKVMADREMLNKFSSLGEKFPDMSLAKKKAALGDAVMVLNQYRNDQSNEVRDAAARQQLQLGQYQLEDIQGKRDQQTMLSNAIRYGLGQPQSEMVTDQISQPVSVQYNREGPFAPAPTPAPQTEDYSSLPRVKFVGEASADAANMVPQFRPLQPQFNTTPTPSIPQTWESVLGAEFANQLGTPVQPAPQRPATTVENQGMTTFETTKQVPVTSERQIPYAQQSEKLTRYLADQGAKPETIAMVPQIMAMLDRQKPMQIDSQTLPSGITVVRADGKIDILPAPKMVEGKDLTEGQSNSLGFAARMMLNESTITDVVNRGYRPGGLTEFGFTPERLRSDDRKIYESAKENWIAATLRKESGAAIGKDEYSAADRQYFPQAGDGDKVLKQKATLRSTVFKSMKTGIGRFADDYLRQMGVGQESQTQGSIRKYNPVTKRIE